MHTSWFILYVLCVSREKIQECIFNLNLNMWNPEAIPVLLKSAHSLSRFRMLLSEWEGKAFLMSSILILRGVSLLFQNSR